MYPRSFRGFLPLPIARTVQSMSPSDHVTLFVSCEEPNQKGLQGVYRFFLFQYFALLKSPILTQKIFLPVIFFFYGNALAFTVSSADGDYFVYYK